MTVHPALVAAALLAGGLMVLVVPAPPDRLASLGRPARERPGVRDRAAGRHLLVGIGLVATLVVVPPLALGVVLWAWARPRLAVRRHDEARARAVESSLPDVVDLLALCGAAGWSLPLAVPLVASHMVGPVPGALGSAHELAGRGVPLADALVASLRPLGDRAAALGHVLADHLRYGSALEPSLERLELELRLHRRRQAERRARRVPVRLILPLVTCTLPAFGLLTVVPLLVGSLRSLSL
ncbi:MAG: type II secretion system F family protein [Acidimicrobiia bacterium]